jgi:hypothetical protein
MLEEYEKLNKLAEAQRIRLKKLQQQEVIVWVCEVVYFCMSLYRLCTKRAPTSSLSASSSSPPLFLKAYNTRINKKLLVNIHRKFMRADKVDQLRKEIEVSTIE